MKKLKAKFNNAFIFLYVLLFGLTPLLMYHKTSEIFEFNKMLFIYYITLIIGCLWCVRMIIYKKVIFKNTVLTIPLLLFLFTQIVSAYFSIDNHTSIFGYYGRFNGGLLSIISYITLYFAFVSNINFTDALKRVTFFLKASIITSVFVMLWGLPSKFGFDLTCLLFTGSPDITCWTNEFQPTIRMFSTLGQPNWLAAYLVVNFFFSLYLLLTRDIKQQWLLYVYMLLNITSIFFTRSRSALLALGVGVVMVGVYLFMTEIYKKGKNEYIAYIKKFITPVIIIILIGFGISYSLTRMNSATPTAESAQETKKFEGEITDSFEIRKLVWQGGYNLGLSNPLFGTGVETFAYAYNFQRPADHNLTSEWDFVYNKAHNELINYFATTGFPGLLAYMLIIGIVASRIKYILEEENKDKQLLEVLLLASFTSLVVSNFFGFSTTTINLYYYLIPAFLIVLLQKPHEPFGEEDTEKVQTIQKALLIIPIIVFLYGVSYLALYFMADVHYSRSENYRLTQEYDQALFYLYYADSLKEDPVYKDKISQILAQKGFFTAFLSKTQNPMCPTDMGGSESCFELSSRYIQKALDASPKNVYYHRSMARNNFLAYQAIGDEGDFDEAITAISKAQELAPTDPRYPYMKSLFFLGRYDSADQPSDVDRELLKFRGSGPATFAIKLKPNYKDAYITRGLIFAALGDRDGARADFQYILDHIDPTDEQAKGELEKLD